MITLDQILPSVYHLQRVGVVGEIWVCARHSKPLKELAAAEHLKAAFPGQTFRAFPSLEDDRKKSYPDMAQKVIGKLPPRQLVIVAVPDTAHYELIKFALEHDQHVLAVKPLVLTYRDAADIEKIARQRGLFVGVEYHKRFDRRALEAKAKFAQGKFGNFRVGEAKLMEPYSYRHSNFQNWFTKENTDPFTYIGCHYVDMVYYITGLKPVEVSVQGVEGKFPNGNVAYMWSAARVAFENGGILSVINGLGYPDAGAGSNDQGMCLFFEGKDNGALIHHNDQFRGVQWSYVAEAGGKSFNYINPDYFRLVPFEGEGLKPVGYGYDSIEANVRAVLCLEAEVAGMPEKESLPCRQKYLKQVDEKGIIATPANSYINELVMEAGRLSIQNGGKAVKISYTPAPKVAFQ